MKRNVACACAEPTKVALRVKAQIARYLENPGIKSPRRADALKAHEENKMATRAQIAAARKNIRKAQAARRKKRGGRRRRAASSASANPRKRSYAKRRRAADNRGRYEENRRRRKARRRPKRRRAAAAANENPVNVFRADQDLDKAPIRIDIEVRGDVSFSVDENLIEARDARA